MAYVESLAHPVLSGVATALRRAALRARAIAWQTNTPLVIFKDGKIERQDVSDTALLTVRDAEAFRAILDKVPQRAPAAGDE